MNADDQVTGQELFWDLAEPLLMGHPGITRSTMMGLPCLRIHGAFFASWDRITGHLLVKLNATRVDAMIADGDANAFAPAGRKFREWASISTEVRELWPTLLQEALAFVTESSSAPKPGTGKRKSI